MLAPTFTPTQNRLVEAATFRSISQTNPFWFGNLAHLYLELRLNLDELEGAESSRKAQQAHEYIRKAAEVCHVVAGQLNGQVLEIHGRTIHIGLEYSSSAEIGERMKEASGLIHILLGRTYGSGGPDGWRIAGDHAATLTVTSEGIHQDTSLVSLSPAANFPAKQLARKKVPRWYAGLNLDQKWAVYSLDELAETCKSRKRVDEIFPGQRNLVQLVEAANAQTINFSSSKAIRQISAQAAPLGNPGANDLYSCYGFVLSMDLDGFTKRVARAAVGSMDDKRKLAEDFLDIMRRAAAFAERHPDTFIQFPFAGDNAIFAVTAENLEDYKARKKVTPVKTAVEWEQAMGDRARDAGYGGWGQSLAGGGTPHGNSKGNLHVAGILLGGRRFLIGIGPGMRHARQGFVHVDPSPKELAMYRPDIADLHERLKKEFYDCPTPLSDRSSNYKKAQLSNLSKALSEVEAERVRVVQSVAQPKIVLPSAAVITHRPFGGLK
ncbi:hypothetical protein JIN84_08960 [Luteolibacter yonseiensis]|uniref:Uncharacterized protein n=1 Tax=Luteolibacter yonseiensis TaxID=1144680 RepID=A0A934R5B9_9BACT|nr:hypothetical protein [Luteolibacter yonseiensis]MBK1815745.1 hypothetical protein [Luteolibacter yonseiensis]